MRRSFRLPVASILLTAGLSGPGLGAVEDLPPAFIRTLEGDATLVDTAGEAEPAEAQDPLGIGDLLSLDTGSLGEIVLPDASRVRATGPVDLLLSADPEAGPAGVTLDLELGELQVRTLPGAEGGGELRVGTAVGVLYLAYPGEYRITADELGLSVIVRQGRIEAVVGERSFLVREGEQADISNEQWPRIDLMGAPARDDLERWAARLEDEAARGDVPWVDPDLRYAAAPLTDNGTWLAVDGGAAWQPAVSASWRPYDDGRWSYASGELYWVSYEPWGWLPYHYGYWDWQATYGWIWFPGHRYAGAHVTFHWGDAWVGWTPSHYYRRHRHAGYGRGGRAVPRDWVYCPSDSLGRRHQNRFHTAGERIDPGHGRSAPGAILTEDTRGLTPDTWRDPDRARTVLQRRAVSPARRVAEGTDRLRSVVRIEPRRDGGVRRATPRSTPLGGSTDRVPSRRADTRSQAVRDRLHAAASATYSDVSATVAPRTRPVRRPYVTQRDPVSRHAYPTTRSPVSGIPQRTPAFRSPAPTVREPLRTSRAPVVQARRPTRTVRAPAATVRQPIRSSRQPARTTVRSPQARSSSTTARGSRQATSSGRRATAPSRSSGTRSPSSHATSSRGRAAQRSSHARRQ